MSVHQGSIFEFEMFNRNGGRLAAIVTVKGGADVAYIRPDGTVQWTEHGDTYSVNAEAQAEVNAMCGMIYEQNGAA